MPLAKLPGTLQDAITVTRLLAIKYLWIDLLCIIQDSKEDWARETARIARIYENSTVTICADAAKDGHSGFLWHPSRLHTHAPKWSASVSMAERTPAMYGKRVV